MSEREEAEMVGAILGYAIARRLRQILAAKQTVLLDDIDVVEATAQCFGIMARADDPSGAIDEFLALEERLHES